jgi:hypothetical protein
MLYIATDATKKWIEESNKSEIALVMHELKETHEKSNVW